MRRYTRYLTKLLMWPTLMIAFCLTSIIWLTQALRFVDFIINRGLSIGDFLSLSLLLVPSLLLMILPIALFIATIYAYQRLTAESELVVLKASGLSPWQLAKPVMYVGLVVSLLCYALALHVMPVTKRQFKDMQAFLRDNYASTLLQEEVFTSPVDGLTVFVRKRDADGKLRGILVHDSRTEGQDITMMAEEATLTQTPSGPRFYLVNGMRQERHLGRTSWLNFDSYNLDISFYTQIAKERKRDTDELLLGELLNPSAEAPGQLISAELHRRFTWPPYAFGLSLLAAAIMLKGEFNRRGQWKRITLLSGGAIGIILGSFGLGNLVSTMPLLAPMLYALSFGVIAAGVYLLLGNFGNGLRTGLFKSLTYLP